MKYKLGDKVYAIVRAKAFDNKPVLSKHICDINQAMININKDNKCALGYILREVFDVYGRPLVYYHYVYEKNVFKTKLEAEEHHYKRDYIYKEYFDEFSDAQINLETSLIYSNIEYNEEFIQKLEDTYGMFKFPKFDGRRQHMQIHIKGDPGNFIPFSMRIHYGTSSYSGKEDEEKGNTIWINKPNNTIFKIKL